MKPYTVKQGSNPERLFNAMRIGIEYCGVDLAHTLGWTSADVVKAMQDAKKRGYVKSRRVGAAGRVVAFYTLLKRPELDGKFHDERHVSRVSIWAPVDVPAAVWPVGPAVDLSNKNNLEAFYGSRA